MSTMQQRTLEIDGMHCDHCVDAVRSALDSVEDLSVLSVEVGTAAVSYDPDDVSTDRIAAALDDAGYEWVS